MSKYFQVIDQVTKLSIKGDLDTPLSLSFINSFWPQSLPFASPYGVVQSALGSVDPWGKVCTCP